MQYFYTFYLFVYAFKKTIHITVFVNRPERDLAVWITILFSSCRDLSEQIKKVTKESHVRAETTELMLSFQRGKVTMQQYKVI